MTKLSLAVRPRGHHNELKGSKTGPRPAPQELIESKTMVVPLARGLAVLAAFGPKQVWVGNKQIALETGLPPPTVSRMLRSLVALGFAHYDETKRKYRLAAPVLGLGYAAIAHGDIQYVAGNEMRTFAESTSTYVTLGIRDRLDVVIVNSYMGSHAMLELDMTPGTRLSIAASVAGAALLAVLPTQELDYLQQTLERKAGPDWPARRKRIAEKISQVNQFGFCTSPGEWVAELTSVSTPICLPNQPPWVLSCTGLTTRMPRMYLDRELGPRLVAIAQLLHDKIVALRT